MIDLSPLSQSDFEQWSKHVRDYMAFYKTTRTDAEYEALWKRLLANQDIQSVGARVNGSLVGFSHYMFHVSAWSADVCYLQDLFVSNEQRNNGVGRSLIEFVAKHAKAKGSPRLYWLTQSSNEVARILYDQVASHSGFIRYEKPLV